MNLGSPISLSPVAPVVDGRQYVVEGHRPTATPLRWNTNAARTAAEQASTISSSPYRIELYVSYSDTTI